MRQSVRGVVVVTAVVVLVAGCGPGRSLPGPAASPRASLAATDASTDASTGDTGTPDAAAPGSGPVRDSGMLLGGPAALGRDVGSLLPADGTHVQVEDSMDGSTVTTVTTPATAAGPSGTLGWVAPPRGGRSEVQGDGSVTLHDEAGAVVAALAAPAGTDGARGTWRPVGDVLALDAPTSSVTFVVGLAALESATWGDADGGRSLLVVPADWVRRGSLAAQHALVSELALAEPESGSASMQAQLWCHVLGAPEKASWNIEPWRPEVPTSTMLLTRCNPTDADR
ncbi:DUF2599 domain-containing protein [Cellulomonas xiejunii]|uniref:DUF2599 domain-containing protein n=1 Tax=Cellulomonas xiejunii TaxID=2968083 RepID=A0ABY5KPQ5_9CELL|nr:DUF2599 domain-containing protein [Cellulomonas xiejunii]MCC2315871.1 DUF2599 domain-containing protein [Cellulomonas xiejunii]MCC2320778.1 DUF2599 domain-containing protein [Cellulomonas xiejunii]UUI71065.1 DUF2599 domain-containing protein [Cellulomonas xiejunii]